MITVFNCDLEVLRDYWRESCPELRDESPLLKTVFSVFSRLLVVEERFSRLPDIRIDSSMSPATHRESHEGGFCPTLSYPLFARPIREGAKRALSRSARPGSRVPGPGAMAGASSQGELDWGFSQVFGERTPGEEVQDGACGRDRVESRRCGGFYATRWETRAPRERARSPETLATRAARVSRTGRLRVSDVATRRSRPPRRRRARRPRAPPRTRDPLDVSVATSHRRLR